jgi:integrase/recombinase XerD
MQQETLSAYLHSMHTAKTAQSYNYSIVKFLSANPKAESYTYQDIVDYMLELKKEGQSGPYRAKILASIKKYYDFLLYIELRPKHPCRRLQIKDDRKKGINFEELFTADELLLLLDREVRYRYLDHRNKLLTSLLIYQGLTSEEVTRLNVSDIDLEKGTVRMRGSRTLHGRVLPMHPTQVNFLTRYLEDSRPFLLNKKRSSSRLFITKLGADESVDTIHAMFQPLKGLFPDRKLCPSTIRMSVISNWLNARKFPLEDVQQMAGHKWPSSTEKYKRIDIDEQRRLINEFHPLQNF